MAASERKGDEYAGAHDASVDEKEKPEEPGSLMPKMMSEMFRDMDPEKMRAMMAQMMPSMMDQFHGKMGEGQMHDMMHAMMPPMMDRCFVQMDIDERRGILRMCREMLDDIEEEYVTEKV